MAKLKQIMGSGCGVKELEHCPPVFHFELTRQELNRLLQDPDTTARLMGMEPGISSIEVQAEGGAVAREITETIYCCIKMGDKLL